MSYDSNLKRDEYPQQYSHKYYGQSNYNQELEFDRHRVSYDSNLEMDKYPQQYGHKYYGQSNYNQELEFDRHRMSYDSNLEMDKYPQQYGHEYYGQSNYNQELEFDRHRMSYDSNLELDDEKSITQELGFNGYENFMERYLQELHMVLAPLEKSFATWILEQCKFFAQRVESFEKLEECLEKLRHSLVHLMKNDLIQELKLGGHKMPYDFNLEKIDFSLENNDQFTKDDEESETKSLNWSDINPSDDLTQECKMPYDLHFEKNDFSMENDQFAKDKELGDEKFTNDLTQEIKLGGGGGGGGGKKCPMILFLEMMI
jgi:hypothetical protein